MDVADAIKYADYTVLVGEPWPNYKQYMFYFPETQKTAHIGRVLLNPEQGLDVDHCSGITHDFRRSELRICTHSENCFNQKMRSTNKSGYRGVYFEKQTQKYRAAITLNHMSYKSGRYDDPVEAALWYDAYAFKARKNFARLNFPELKR